MITGATQADVALLVVPASLGEYESSMKIDSQTREHAILLKALGVNQVIVVVNKMDSCEWDKNRFDCIEVEVRALLTSLQFGPKAVRFLPVSGLSGENLMALSADNPVNNWYNGPTLIKAIDTFKEPVRPVNKPLRAIETAIMKESKQTCEVSVKVLQGRVLKGRGLGIGSSSSTFSSDNSVAIDSTCLPPGQGSFFIADVKKTLVDGLPTCVLYAGQNGVLSLTDRGGLSGEEMSLREGLVLFKSPPDVPPLRKCKKFRATIQTLGSLLLPLIAGSVLDLYLHGEEIQCFIKKIYSVTVKGGKKEIKNPKCIPSNSVAMVKIKMEREAFVENFHECNALGRFALRTRGVTSAVGVCTLCYI
jgi:elongation factor 1 alpha-like protein